MSAVSDEAVEAAAWAIADYVGETRFGYEPHAQVAITAAEPFIAARVRADAVAEERQRIDKVRDLHPPTSGDDGEAVCATCVNLGEHDSWPCATLLVLAAGSVPVATPKPPTCLHGEQQAHWAWEPNRQATTGLFTYQCPGPVAIPPPERSVPEAKETKTAAQLIREIAAADPEAHLRAIGRAYAGSGPAIPVEPTEACGCAACMPDGPIDGKCRCDVCIRSAIWHPESTCTCRLCRYARSLAPVEAVSGGSGHAERQEDRPVEIASLPIEELPDWTDLAEAVGATLHSAEVGCSGEYQTEMRWPDGRVATYRDRLAIISADSELPPVEWQIIFERMQANCDTEVARCRAAIEQVSEAMRQSNVPPEEYVPVEARKRLLNALTAALGGGE